ncbi:MAG: hypothetical protein ACK4OM_00580 [Alphaproteobacteria bacterium]
MFKLNNLITEIKSGFKISIFSYKFVLQHKKIAFLLLLSIALLGSLLGIIFGISIANQQWHLTKHIGALSWFIGAICIAFIVYISIVMEFVGILAIESYLANKEVKPIKQLFKHTISKFPQIFKSLIVKLITGGPSIILLPSILLSSIKVESTLTDLLLLINFIFFILTWFTNILIYLNPNLTVTGAFKESFQLLIDVCVHKKQIIKIISAFITAPLLYKVILFLVINILANINSQAALITSIVFVKIISAIFSLCVVGGSYVLTIIFYLYAKENIIAKGMDKSLFEKTI